MANKPSSPAPAASEAAPAWLSYLFVGLAGILVGSSFTYLALRSQLSQRASAPMQLSAMPGSPTPTADHVPPANLTEGLAPAQADRALGNWHYDHRNWAEAQQRYESAIRQGSDDSDIRTDLGNVYRFLGRPTDALTQYQLAQRMNPQHEFSLFNQGTLLLDDLKDAAGAMAVWKQYLERFPNGRNVRVVRDMLAQVTGSAPMMPASGGPMPPPTDATTQRLLDLVNQTPEPKKP